MRRERDGPRRVHQIRVKPDTQTRARLFSVGAGGPAIRMRCILRRHPREQHSRLVDKQAHGDAVEIDPGA